MSDLNKLHLPREQLIAEGQKQARIHGVPAECAPVYAEGWRDAIEALRIVQFLEARKAENDEPQPTPDVSWVTTEPAEGAGSKWSWVAVLTGGALVVALLAGLVIELVKS